MNDQSQTIKDLVKQNVSNSNFQRNKCAEVIMDTLKNEKVAITRGISSEIYNAIDLRLRELDSVKLTVLSQKSFPRLTSDLDLQTLQVRRAELHVKRTPQGDIQDLWQMLEKCHKNWIREPSERRAKLRGKYITVMNATMKVLLNTGAPEDIELVKVYSDKVQNLLAPERAKEPDNVKIVPSNDNKVVNVADRYAKS